MATPGTSLRGLPNINAKLCQQIFLGLFIPDTVRFLNQPRQLFKQRIGFAFSAKSAMAVSGMVTPL
ncbi:hypothetical protein ACVV4A_22465 [Escherichia coli]